jgi:hypothetical protein
MNNYSNEYDAVREMEFELLNQINNSHLKQHLTDPRVFFDCGSKNFTRLYERYKFDNSKIPEIINDWKEYIKALSQNVYERELMDVSDNEEYERHVNEVQRLWTQIDEIHRRIKKLLGKEYIDPVLELEEQKKWENLKNQEKKKPGQRN